MADLPASTPSIPTGIAQPSATAPFNFKGILQEMIRQGASDLHLKVGRPPTLRLHGDLTELSVPAMRPEDLKSLAEQVMSARQVKEFAEHREADFAIGVPGIGRFRVNVYQQRGTIAFAMRAIAYQASSIRELNLPPVRESRTAASGGTPWKSIPRIWTGNPPTS